MSEKTTKEILIEISDLLKDRQDVLNALAATLHSHPLTVFNSLESAIHEANIKDVTIPEEDVDALLKVLSEEEINTVVTRITDIFNIEWTVNPKAIQMLARRKTPSSTVIMDTFVETPETLQIKKDKMDAWKKKGDWKDRAPKTIKPTDKRTIGQLSMEESLANILNKK